MMLLLLLLLLLLWQLIDAASEHELGACDGLVRGELLDDDLGVEIDAAVDLLPDAEDELVDGGRPHGAVLWLLLAALRDGFGRGELARSWLV